MTLINVGVTAAKNCGANFFGPDFIWRVKNSVFAQTQFHHYIWLATDRNTTLLACAGCALAQTIRIAILSLFSLQASPFYPVFPGVALNQLTVTQLLFSSFHSPSHRFNGCISNTNEFLRELKLNWFYYDCTIKQQLIW